ncbi:hypothetical protein V6Z11_A08G124300 [Gossypium hirsutum]
MAKIPQKSHFDRFDLLKLVSKLKLPIFKRNPQTSKGPCDFWPPFIESGYLEFLRWWSTTLR